MSKHKDASARSNIPATYIRYIINQTQIHYSLIIVIIAL